MDHCLFIHVGQPIKNHQTNNPRADPGHSRGPTTFISNKSPWAGSPSTHIFIPATTLPTILLHESPPPSEQAENQTLFIFFLLCSSFCLAIVEFRNGFPFLFSFIYLFFNFWVSFGYMDSTFLFYFYLFIFFVKLELKNLFCVLQA